MNIMTGEKQKKILIVLFWTLLGSVAAMILFAALLKDNTITTPITVRKTNIPVEVINDTVAVHSSPAPATANTEQRIQSEPEIPEAVEEKLDPFAIYPALGNIVTVKNPLSYNIKQNIFIFNYGPGNIGRVFTRVVVPKSFINTSQIFRGFKVMKEVDAYLFEKVRKLYSDGSSELDGNGNKYLSIQRFSLKENEKCIYKVRYRAQVYEIIYNLKDYVPPPYSRKTLGRMAQFLKSEPLIESGNPSIRRRAQQLSAGIKNPITVAKKIYDYVGRHIHYSIQKKERGALYAFKKRTGDCSEHSFLFVALCRAAKIPARTVGGFMYGIISDYNYHHQWAEFYVEGLGWVPADPVFKGRSKCFGRLTNNHITLYKDKVGKGKRLDRYEVFNYSSDKAQTFYKTSVKIEITLDYLGKSPYKYIKPPATKNKNPLTIENINVCDNISGWKKYTPFNAARRKKYFYIYSEVHNIIHGAYVSVDVFCKIFDGDELLGGRMHEIRRKKESYRRSKYKDFYIPFQLERKILKDVKGKPLTVKIEVYDHIRRQIRSKTFNFFPPSD